jgi:hypothetical protein
MASLFRRALAIFESCLDPDHPKVVTWRENFEDVVREQAFLHREPRGLIAPRIIPVGPNLPDGFRLWLLLGARAGPQGALAV